MDSAKRFIGRQWSEVDEEARLVSYITGQSDKGGVSFNVGSIVILARMLL